LGDDEIEQTLMFFADILQLTPMLDNRAGDLSGGQKRKLCIALSLLGHPRIVLMDEPTAGVDVQARQLIWKTIATLQDTTVIVTSHALEEAEAVSSRLFVVIGGKLPFVGTSTELRNEFKCGYILRIEGNIAPVFALAQERVPGAKMAARPDTIEMPVNREVPAFIREFEERKDEFGVISYSFAAEQLENVLLKLIETEEAKYEGNAKTGIK
jgi:ABC-type multidrug transport system ATPase subunit